MAQESVSARRRTDSKERVDGLGMETLGAASSPSRKAIVGACVLSATGSLPLHLMPFLVALTASEGRLDPERSGWLSSALMCGMLASALSLPLLRFTRVTPLAAFVAVIFLLGGILSSVNAGPVGILVCWCVAGAVCGLFQFLGSTSAASYADRHFVFGLRLALVMFAAAGFIGFGAYLGGFESYMGLTAGLSVLILFACCVGLALYSPPLTQSQLNAQAEEVADSTGRWQGLTIAYLYFAGQPGFMAYAAYIALSHGIPAGDLPFAFAAAKVCGAVVLLKWGSNTRSGAPTLLIGSLLGISSIAIATTDCIAVFSLALIGWEICVNVQSTRLQATVVSDRPYLGGLWLPAALALGASTGPVLHGHLLGQSNGHWFIAFSVATGLLPGAWCRWRSRPRHELVKQ
jgi:hypothetical protein